MYAKHTPQHLAWHETMEMHEIVAMLSSDLIMLKRHLPLVRDSALHALYREAIQCQDAAIRELLPFYPLAPAAVRDDAGGEASVSDSERDEDMTGYYAGRLLICFKTAVRNYAIALTETATPQLREVFDRQLQQAIRMHGKVFYFMLERSYYPAYDLHRLLGNDVAMASRALGMR